MRKAMMIVIVMLFASIPALAQSSAAAHDQHMEHMSFTAVEQDWAKARADKSPRHQEWVKVKNGTRDVNSFLVFPEVKNKATAVVVIHEIFGMSDWVRSLTDQLAEAGYIAIAPALLSGVGPTGGAAAEFARSGIGQAPLVFSRAS